ncbi:MAG: hypothetical protein MJK04_11040, partial [Psychrosphaera sp.]|nr:hypothetical protein [Psychrosphaera sp.]
MDLTIFGQPTVLLSLVGVLLLLVVIGLLLRINRRLKHNYYNDNNELLVKSVGEQLDLQREQLTHLLYNQFGEGKEHSQNQFAQQKQYIFALLSEQKQSIENKFNEQLMANLRSGNELKENLMSLLSAQKDQFNENQVNALTKLNEQLSTSTKQSR